MPFYNVTPHAILVEAGNPMEAAVLAYKIFQDRASTRFEVSGPDEEVSHVVLEKESQVDADG